MKPDKTKKRDIQKVPNSDEITREILREPGQITFKDALKKMTTLKRVKKTK